MLIFDDKADPVIIDSIYVPTPVNYFWVLDLAIADFKLTQLTMLEEHSCPSMIIEIEGFKFTVPASWHILLMDDETFQLDCIQISEAAGRDFHALIYGPNAVLPHKSLITVLGYMVEHTNVNPVLHKHQMLCHPIGPKTWINISPTDQYTKYIKNIQIGDLINY